MYSEVGVHPDVNHGGLRLQSFRVEQQGAHYPIGEAKHYDAACFVDLGVKRRG